MNQTTGISGPAPTATFHARVAGVGLVTTLVVLIAACLTFLLQQWAVARTQSHQMQVSLAQVTATTEEAQRLGFTGTPSFAIKGPNSNGIELLGTPSSPEEVEEEIDKAR